MKITGDAASKKPGFMLAPYGQINRATPDFRTPPPPDANFESQLTIPATKTAGKNGSDLVRSIDDPNFLRRSSWKRLNRTSGMQSAGVNL
jgi:hypothetical protein